MGKLFQAEYLPLLKSARKAGATIVVGNGNSVDALVKTYLSDSGYAILEHPSGYAEAVPPDRALERQAVLQQMVARTPAPAEPILPVAEVKTKKTSNQSAKTEIKAEVPSDGTKKRTTKAKTPVQTGEPTTSTKLATKAQAQAKTSAPALEPATGTKRSSKARAVAEDTLASLSITATVETEVETESLEPSLAM